jgi:putative PIG3 family NAD(P)H quinone oxidoreductase
MRAVVFDQPGDETVLRVADVPPPPLRTGELRLAVHATALNRADLLQRLGKYPPPPGASEVLGLECAGEVIEVAPGVRGWKPGDRAMALLAGGGYADEAVTPAGCVMPIPEGMPYEEAGAFPEAFLTVFLTVFRLGGLRAGGSVLVHGGGSGIGTTAITLVKAVHGTVVVTAGSDDKCVRCLGLGADLAVNYRDAEFVAPVREITGGRGVDVVLDAIGAPYLERNLAALATGGKLIVIGLMGGGAVEVNLRELLSRRLSIVGSTLRTRSVEEKSGLVAAFLDRFGDLLSAYRLRPVIDRVLPLEQAAEAHRVMAASRHFGKIVLRVR